MSTQKQAVDTAPEVSGDKVNVRSPEAHANATVINIQQRSQMLVVFTLLLSALLAAAVLFFIVPVLSGKYIPEDEWQIVEATSSSRVVTAVAATITALVTPPPPATATPDVTATAAADSTRIAAAVQETHTALAPSPVKSTATPHLTATESAINRRIDGAVQATLTALAITGSAAFSLTETTEPEATPFVSSLIEAGPKHLGDEKEYDWDVKEPESRFEKTVSLSQIPSSGVLLVLDSFHVNGANPVWMNGKYIGNLPGTKEERWDLRLQMYIPPSYVQPGKNTLTIQPGLGEIKTIWGAEPDDFMIRNVMLEPVPALELSDLPLTELVIDSDTSHVGAKVVDFWEVPNPTGEFYNKEFSIAGQPTGGGILSLQGYDAQTAIPVRLNGVVLGNMPSIGKDSWSPEVRFWVPSGILRPGINTVQAGPPAEEDDNFMIRNVKIEVPLQ